MSQLKLSEAIRQGGEGRQKTTGVLYGAGTAAECPVCALGAAAMAVFGAEEALLLYHSHKGVPTRLVERYPILGAGFEGHPTKKGFNTLMHIITAMNDYTDATFSQIADLVAEKEVEYAAK